MPLFKRGRKQDEEDLQWLYRNLQELDDDEPAGEDAVKNEPAENDEDGVSAEIAMESPPEPELSEPPPEPVLGEPEPEMMNQLRRKLPQAKHRRLFCRNRPLRNRRRPNLRLWRCQPRFPGNPC